MNPPNFDGIYGMTANPLRQVFMMGAIWRLAVDRQNAHLNILEIGSWSGASALTWGEALKFHNDSNGCLTCVDAWRPYYDVDAGETPDEVGRQINEALSGEEPYQVFQQNVKHLPREVNLTVLRGWSNDILPTLPSDSFDLVYIDGDHTYQGVSADIENSCVLVKDGGIICGDDLELQAHQVDASIAAEQPHLDKYYDEASNRIYHPGVTLAVAEKFGPVSSWYGFWAMRKSSRAWRSVSLKNMPARIPSYLSNENLIGLKAVLMKHGLI